MNFKPAELYTTTPSGLIIPKSMLEPEPPPPPPLTRQIKRARARELSKAVRKMNNTPRRSQQ